MRVTASRAAGREGDSQRDITNKERERVIGEGGRGPQEEARDHQDPEAEGCQGSQVTVM